MQKKLMDKSNNYLFWLCLFFIVLKLISISTTNLNLYGDEAQYWLWSKQLSFGYFSKPPLLSWVIRFITNIFGDSFFVLKSIPIFLYCITSYFIFIFAKKLFNDLNLATHCALTFFLLPSVSLSSFLLSTDILLVLLWTGALIQVLKIKENPSYFNFLILGLLIGFAFLAKYAAIYFLISLTLFLAIEKSYRLVFIQSKLKLFFSFLIIILTLLPNILWNYQNGWLTLNHTANNISFDKIQLNVSGSFEFLISQIIMIGPILFISFCLFSYKNIKINTNEKFLISFALPTLIIVLIESLLVRAHANWAAISLITLSIFFIGFIYKINKNALHLNNLINLVIGCILFIMIAVDYPLSAFNRITGIKEFVQFLDEKNKDKINNFVVSDRLLFASLNYSYYQKNINFYSPWFPKNKITHHFQLKNALPNDFSQSFILVGNKNDIDYLQKDKKIKLLGSKSFPFSKTDIKIYEIFIK